VTFLRNPSDFWTVDLRTSTFAVPEAFFLHYILLSPKDGSFQLIRTALVHPNLSVFPLLLCRPFFSPPCHFVLRFPSTSLLAFWLPCEGAQFSFGLFLFLSTSFTFPLLRRKRPYPLFGVPASALSPSLQMREKRFKGHSSPLMLVL